MPCACTTLRKAARAVARVYDDALAGSGMTTAQFSILRHLARTPGIELSRLADKLVMERTSLYRAMAPLEARGWISTKPGKGKARVAELTGEGRTAMRAAEPAWEEVQRRVVTPMGDAWAGLESALRALTKSVQGELA